jgi:hypothetical protein
MGKDWEDHNGQIATTGRKTQIETKTKAKYEKLNAWLHSAEIWASLMMETKPAGS